MCIPVYAVPASCTEINLKDVTAKSGTYKIRPISNGDEFSVYCDMESHGGGWTLVTLLKSNKYGQWNPDALHPEDLATLTKSPSRVSKLSDDDINALLGKGGTRWVTAGDKGHFYRMTDSPWYSNHGKNEGTCNYKRDFTDAMAVPSTTPVWDTTLSYVGCGGAHDGSNWGTLSGIHEKSSHSENHKGAYALPIRWGQNGHVFVRSASFVPPNYICKTGQLAKDIEFAEHSANSKDACAAKCDTTPGCVAFDFTTVDRDDVGRDDTCRLSKSAENGRADGGDHERQRCARPGAPTPRVSAPECFVC